MIIATGADHGGFHLKQKLMVSAIENAVRLNRSRDVRT